MLVAKWRAITESIANAHPQHIVLVKPRLGAFSLPSVGRCMAVCCLIVPMCICLRGRRPHEYRSQMKTCSARPQPRAGYDYFFPTLVVFALTQSLGLRVQIAHFRVSSFLN